MPLPILSTKLFIPKIRENHIVRKPLVDKLVNGISSGNKLSLICAPAGYGKTTLVLELLASMDAGVAWISLDEGDNDIVQFLSYLIAAFKKAGVSAGSMEEAILDFRVASTRALITMLINEVSILREKLILVLDDFHRIHADTVFDVVKFLIDHQPPNLHLVIITREDPPLPLPRIRVQGRIAEIRLEDLCFNRDEAAKFFSQAMKLTLSGEAIDAITARTEGWIAGLQLTGLSLKGCAKRDVETFIQEFHDTHSYIVDYLVEEVISRQKEEVREFLCKTSVLDRMNGDLCDAVTERNDGRILLREIEKSNLFLISLDSKREWYRYHHLFADSLRMELSKEEEMLLHRKAALWLKNNGFFQEALDHAFQSGDTPMALRLVEGSMAQAFENAQLTTFLKWVDMLPDKLVRGSETLSVRKAWVLLMIGKGSETHAYLDSLGEGFLETATPHNKGLYLSLKALISQYSGAGDAERQAEEALRYLDPGDATMRAAALNTLGRAQEDNGKTGEAVRTLRLAYNECQKLGYTFVTTLTLMNLGTNLNTMGKRKEALVLYQEYIGGMTAKFGKPLPFIGIIYVGMAGLYYESNELEKAKSYMDEGSELCQSIFYNWIENKGILESRIQFALGETEAAVETIRKSIAPLEGYLVTKNLVLNIAVLAEFLQKSRNTEEAGRYGEKLKCFTQCDNIPAAQHAYLPFARLLIYQKRWEEALKFLERIEESLEKTKKGRELITYYLLYAKARFMGGDYDGAKACFEKAASLAEPQGYYRLFLDEEPIIRDIVFSGKIASGAFGSRIAELMKAPAAQAVLPFGMPDKRTGSEQKKTGGLEPIEKLSQRETDILELLGQGMTNEEIAKKLYISVNTAQWHISHIYSKLGVRSRTQALLKARELNLI